MKSNYRFNRRERKGKHQYVKEFPSFRRTGGVKYSGYVKCKLVHHEVYSTIVPDQVYLTIAGETLWIQPLYFMASFILFSETRDRCRLTVDISLGAMLAIDIQSDWLLSRLPDGSFLYRCEIEGPAALFRYATGKAHFVGNIPYVRLFHHTNLRAKEGILDSSTFWTSTWNLQGTRQLSNIAYLYLTPLDQIVCEEDLREIAMSSVEFVPLRLDQNMTNVPDELLHVYRESTSNRRHSIACWARADALSSQHIYRHAPVRGAVYYEIVCPFIQRVGANVGSVIEMQRNTLSPVRPKQFEYVVVGDASSLEGLRAPYDEEDTTQIWKIDNASGSREIIRHWSTNPNSDLYSQIPVEMAAFDGTAC